MYTSHPNLLIEIIRLNIGIPYPGSDNIGKSLYFNSSFKFNSIILFLILQFLEKGPNFLHL